MKRRTNLAVILAFLLPALILLAACEGDIEDAADDVTTPTEQAAEETATPDPEPTETGEPTEPEDGETPAPSPTIDEETSPSPTATDDDQAGEDGDTGEREVLVYLVRDEQIAVTSRSIAGTPEVAAGAMNELLTGVTQYEEDLGFSSEVPFETDVVGINLDEDGTVVVDLSSEFVSGGGSFSMQMRVAQVVYTLTQFDTIDQIDFLIDGEEVDGLGGEGLVIEEPLARADFEELAPAILVESPTPGEEVSSPIHLTGTANTFEATFQVEIVDNSGTVIYDDFATATSGSGTRGTFDLELPVDVTQEGLGTVTLYEESARDGSATNVVEIPVDLRQ